jgi:hypothetical protein
MRQGFLLRDIGGKGSPFCSPMAAETVHKMPAAVTQFGRRLAMVKAVSDEALASGTQTLEPNLSLIRGLNQ